MIDRLGKTQGLTLVELAITLTIIGVLVVAMIPGLGRWLSHHRIKGVARDVSSCFRLAQMTAIQRNQTCSVQFNTNNSSVRVLDSGGVPIRDIDLNEYKAQFNGFDFVDVGADGLISVVYNTRGIPSNEEGNPLATPGVQAGERVSFVNGQGETYWVEVTPVGTVRYDRQ